jgi:hypothetical protein
VGLLGCFILGSKGYKMKITQNGYTYLVENEMDIYTLTLMLKYGVPKILVEHFFSRG